MRERKEPGKNTAAVAGVASGTTGLEVRLVIRLNSIAFGALLTDPLFVIAVLPSEMFFDADQIAKSV